MDNKYKIVCNHDKKEYQIRDKNNTTLLILNPILIGKQKVKEKNIEKLLEIYIEGLCIEYKMRDEEYLKENRKELTDQWTNNQYKLQELWGFEKNIKMHKFWNVPNCTCPKLDNEDIYPSEKYWTNANCPVHNWEDLI